MNRQNQAGYGYEVGIYNGFGFGENFDLGAVHTVPYFGNKKRQIFFNFNYDLVSMKNFSSRIFFKNINETLIENINSKNVWKTGFKIKDQTSNDYLAF